MELPIKFSVSLFALLIVCIGTAVALPTATVEWHINLTIQTGEEFYGTAPVYYDIDGDGAIEVVTSFYSGMRVFAFDGRTGGIDWIFPPLDQDTMPARGGYSACIADVTMDGKPNVIVSVRAAPGHIYCLDGNGNLIWEFDTTDQTVGTGGHTHYITVPRDIDGDEIPEMITGGYRGGHIWVVKNDGTLKWYKNMYNQPIRLANALDIDKDGANDVLICARDTTTAEGAVIRGAVYCLGGDGNERWRYDGEGGEDLIDFAYTYVSVADVNDDTEYEIIFGTRDADSLVVLDWLGQQLWRFTETGEPPVQDPPTDEWPMIPMIADVDQDGKMEIVAATDTMKVFCFDGFGNVEWYYSYDWVGGGPGYGGALADVTGDGDINTLIVTDSNGTLVVLDSKGEPAAEPFHLGGNIYGVAVGDLDADGRAEIILADQGGVYSITYGGAWNPSLAPWPMMGRDQAHYATVSLNEGILHAIAAMGLAGIGLVKLRGRK